MAQYRPIVNVTNASATVTVPGVDATAEIAAGNYFDVNGDGVWYQVASAPTYTAPDTTVTLAAPYQGVTASGVQGVFVRDFTADGIPVANRQDLETASLMGRLANVVQGLFDAIIGGTKALTNALLYDTSKVANAADTTKVMQLDVSGVTAGQTRVLGVPDYDATLIGANEVRGIATHNMTADADYTVTAAQARNAVIHITDTGAVLTAPRNIIVPTEARIYVIHNATAQTLTVKTAAGTGVDVPTGMRGSVYCDGTDVLPVLLWVPGLNLGGNNLDNASVISAGAGTQYANIGLDTSGNIKLRYGSNVQAILNGNGILALGKSTTENWGSGQKVIEIGPRTSLWGASWGTSYLVTNAYWDGSNWKYQDTAPASQINFNSSGDIIFQTAPSGTADTNASFNTSLKILNDGSIATSGNPLYTQGDSNVWKGTSATDGARVDSIDIAVQRGSGACYYAAKPTGWTDGSFHNFRVADVGVGNISTDGSTTAYNTTSDYRLKANWHPIVDATEQLMALRPYEGEFQASPGQRQHYLLAHEAQEIVPWAVQGKKDGDEMQSMDYSKLVPLLTAALQEATQRLTALEARVAELNERS